MPEIQIVEQPSSNGMRFRYECEGITGGSILGVSSKKGVRTFPAIRVVGCHGRRAFVIVSCVTTQSPHRPHPFNLVGKDGCKKGVATMELPPDTMYVEFRNLGIQCVRKKDITSSLEVREQIRVDPFNTGFAHKKKPASIELNSVRLCFQVFLESTKSPGQFNVPLAPKVSNPINDRKLKSNLSITKLSDCVSFVDGGQKDIILLCEKVVKEDIQVRFFEEVDGVIVWEDYAEIQPRQVYKQHAIWFRTPSYKNLDATDVIKVNIQLKRPSDGATSEPLPFQFIPSNNQKAKRKRPMDLDYSDLNLADAGAYSYPTPGDGAQVFPTQSPHYNMLSPATTPGTNAFTFNIPHPEHHWTSPTSNTNNIPYYQNSIAGPSRTPTDWASQQGNLIDLGPDLNNLSISDIVPELNTADS